MKLRRIVPWIALLALLTPLPAAAAKSGLDDGLLDPAWFPGAGEFRETPSFDYVWVKDGFTFQGRTVHVKDWEGPVWLDEERDVKDRSKGEELTEVMPAWLRGALKGALGDTAPVSKDEGDLIVEGRFVDVNAGSKAAKWIVGFGAGSAAATWDIKFVDAASGEVVAAIHHRSISGTHLSDIDDKIRKWMQEFAGAAAADFKEYAAGKKRKK